MIRIDTGFYIFDRPIIMFFYKKKYSVKIRFIRLICVLSCEINKILQSFKLFLRAPP
jgi:hypothetical protein